VESSLLSSVGVHQVLLVFMLSWGGLAAVLLTWLGFLWRRYECWLPEPPPEPTLSPQLQGALPSLPATKLSERPFASQLRSFEFFMVLTFASVNLTRANMYIGTNDLLLDHLGDSSNTYKKIFSIVLPCGPLMVPIIEKLDSKLGPVWCLQITCLLAAAYNGVALINSLPAQIAGFVVYTSFRAFLYSVLASFVADRFGLATLGRIQGTIFTIAGVVNLVQYPLVASIHSMNGDPFWVNVGQLAVLVPLMMLVEVMRRKQASVDPNAAQEEVPQEERQFLARAASSLGSPSLGPNSKWRLVQKNVRVRSIAKLLAGNSGASWSP